MKSEMNLMNMMSAGQGPRRFVQHANRDTFTEFKLAEPAEPKPKTDFTKGDRRKNAVDDESHETSFKKVYDDIAQSNKNAQSRIENNEEDRREYKNEGKKIGKAESKIKDKENEEDKPESVIPLSNEVVTDAQVQDAQLAAILGIDTVQKISELTNASSTGDLQPKKNVDSEKAITMISDAIKTITQALNIKTQPDLSGLSLENVSQGTVDQLAEMLTALKGIAEVLDESIAQNQPVEYNSIVFDMPKAAEVQQTIHKEVFTIEMALKTVGLAGRVANAMVDNKENNGLGNGIIQATNPSTLSMPLLHVKQILGEKIVSKEQKIETLFQKLASALSKKGEPDSSALMSKIVSVTQTKTTEVPVVKPLEIGAFDPQVLRKMLKIDSQTLTVAQNQAAAKESETSGIVANQGIITSKDLAKALLQTKPDEQIPVVSQGNAALVNNGNNSVLGLTKAVETHLTKHVEDSVMNQITEKMNVAIKNGVTEMRVLLRPEALGEVQLKIRVEGDVVMGKMYVESQQVKHIVEANLQNLKDSLGMQNLHMGSFSVDINHGNAHDQMRDMAQNAMQDGDFGKSKQNENYDESTTDGQGNAIVAGIETGRKYGTNSIEYFA